MIQTKFQEYLRIYFLRCLQFGMKRHEKRRNDTELSKHLWKLKEKKEGYSISWKIIAKAKAYSNTTKRCNLCITEKFFILSNPQMATLDKRNELISNCRHRRKYILKYSFIIINAYKRIGCCFYGLTSCSVSCKN